MTIKTSSAKAKGRRLQDLIRDKVQETFDLSGNDVKSAVMGESGLDIKLSDQAREKFPYGVEAKAYARVAVFSWWKQAKENAEAEGLTPILVFKQDRSKPLVAMELDHFMELAKCSLMTTKP